MSTPMPTSLTEHNLVDVFIANRPQLRRVAQKIVHTADLADEIIQDAYIKVVEAAPRRTVHKPLGYCHQIVRNLAYDHHRGRSAEDNHVDRSADVDQHQAEDSGPATELVLGHRQALEAVDRLLSTLHPRARRALELNRIGGLTQREVGRHLGCSATLVNFMIKEADQLLQGSRHLLAAL